MPIYLLKENSMQKRLFGKLADGREVFCYKITNGNASATIMEYGATVTSLCPFGETDVVGGFDTLLDYLNDNSNQGAVIGRVSNRIKDARFEIDGAVYKLHANDNKNCLHSGTGFQRRLWQTVDLTKNSVTLKYFSPDGEDGFPANLTVFVKYTLKNSALIICYKAQADAKTPIALTNHAYFNLDGFGGDIKNHSVQIWADRYTEVDDELIPNGKRPLVANTPLDFTRLKKIGESFCESFNGYDHNMIASPKIYKEFGGKTVGLLAKVENSKMTMNMYSDQPGLQFYTGNFLGDGPDFKGGVAQIRYGGLCLETQTEPNCVNHSKAIYKKDEDYLQLTAYEFILK